MLRETLINLENVSFSFGERKLFKKINLKIYREEIFILTGEGGCGLSSFLKLVSGTLKPLEGIVKIFNMNIRKASRRQMGWIRSSMGYVFQNGALLNNMTLMENIALPLRYHTNLKECDIQIIVKEKLHFVGIEGLEHHLPLQLSEDHKKKGALARALVLDPKIIFFDEPTSGVDECHSRSFLNLFGKLREEHGTSSVLVSRNAALAFNVADRMAILEDGKLIQE